jgi:hypothetical protein
MRSNGFGNALSISDIGIVTKLCCHVSHLLKATLLQLFFVFSEKSNKNKELKRKTIAKSKVKEKLTKVKNLCLSQKRC